MDRETERRIKLGGAASQAELISDMLKNFRAEVVVRLGIHGTDEDFTAALEREIAAVATRFASIFYDLGNLAHSVDFAGFGDERYRLAHRGMEPGAEADRKQLAAIEGVRGS